MCVCFKPGLRRISRSGRQIWPPNAWDNAFQFHCLGLTASHCRNFMIFQTVHCFIRTEYTRRIFLPPSLFIEKQKIRGTNHFSLLERRPLPPHVIRTSNWTASAASLLDCAPSAEHCGSDEGSSPRTAAQTLSKNNTCELKGQRRRNYCPKHPWSKHNQIDLINCSWAEVNIEVLRNQACWKGLGRGRRLAGVIGARCASLAMLLGGENLERLWDVVWLRAGGKIFQDWGRRLVNKTQPNWGVWNTLGQQVPWQLWELASDGPACWCLPWENECSSVLMQVFRARWIEAIFKAGRGKLGRPLKINVCPQTSQPQIGRNLWLYLIQWLQLPWKKFMALALPVFLFLWKAYSRMERQVIEFQKFPMVQKFGVSLEQM